MSLQLRRLLVFTLFLGLLSPLSPVRGEEDAATETQPEVRRPDSPSLHFHVTDMPGAWQALRETRLRQTIEAMFAIPFIAEDDSIVTLVAGLEDIAGRGGIEPTIDSLVGENTHQVRFVLFEDENLDDPSGSPYFLEATMASSELAGAVADTLRANLEGNGTTVSAVGETLTITNAPDRMIQDRLDDWRAPLVDAAFEEAPLEGAQIRFFAQPARDEEPGGGDKVSAGRIRIQPERIDVSVHALPVREDGALRFPAADGLASLDKYVVLAERPHVLSLAYHGANAMLENAARDSETSRGRRIAVGLERYTGASTAEMLEAFGDNATLAVNNLSMRGPFDFNIGVTGAWEVRDPAKAAGILATLQDTHRANLARDAQSYGRATDGLRFREEEHRGLTVWSAPLMIFPIQPSNPPTLNLALTDEVLLMATSRPAMHSLIGRYLDGSGDTSAIDRARAGHDLPGEVHSLMTADFAAFSEVFRAAVPMIVALTQGGQESQVFGRAFADVLGALGQGTATGVYQPEGQSVRATLLLAAPNPGP